MLYYNLRFHHSTGAKVHLSFTYVWQAGETIHMVKTVTFSIIYIFLEITGFPEA